MVHILVNFFVMQNTWHKQLQGGNIYFYSISSVLVYGGLAPGTGKKIVEAGACQGKCCSLQESEEGIRG